VFIDADSNDKTGMLLPNYIGIAGLDYSLSLMHYSNGKVRTIPFNQAFQKDVWQCDSKGCGSISGAENYADKTNKLIILRGKIPGINSNSRILFSEFYITKDNKQTFNTNFVTFKTLP
jgi:hypothetical protein